MRLTVDAAPVNQVGVRRPVGVVAPSTCHETKTTKKKLKSVDVREIKRPMCFFFFQNDWRHQREIFILARWYVEETLQTLGACAVFPSPENAAHHQVSSG